MVAAAFVSLCIGARKVTKSDQKARDAVLVKFLQASRDTELFEE